MGRRTKSFGGQLGDILSRYEPSSALADKTTDAGPVKPGGRVDTHWGEVDVHTVALTGRKEERKDWMRDPLTARERFGLHSIEFGNWMNEQDRQSWLYGVTTALQDLATIIGVPARAMGLNGTLSIALGARGKLRTWAHYEPGKIVINLTKTAGDRGVVAHEYAHAIDDFIRRQAKLPEFPSGGRSIRRQTRMSILRSNTIWTSLFEKLFHSLYYSGPDLTKTTPFYHVVAQLEGEYPQRREEVFARAVEVWIKHELDQRGIINKFLSVGKRNKSYPTEKLITDAAPTFQRIFRQALNIAVPPLQEEKKPGKEESKKGKKKKEAPAARQRYDGSIALGNETSIATRQGDITTRYALVELDSLIPSHNPRTWSRNPNYPTGCQQRDYKADKAEQNKVLRNARDFDPRFLIADTPTATDGAPVVTPTRIVLGGNSRTMSAQIASADKWDAYLVYLRRAAGLFGIDASAIDLFDKPFLIRLIPEIQPQECATYSNVLNKSLTQDVDIVTEAVSLGRQLLPENLERIADYFQQAETQSGATTLAQALNINATQHLIINELRRAGVVNAQNQSQWINPTTRALSEYGRLAVQLVLLGTILPSKQEIEAAASYTGAITRILPLVSRLQRLPGEWNIIPLIREAIQRESERRAAGLKKGDYLNQISFDRADIPEPVRILWDQLDAGPKQFTAFAQSYMQRAEHAVKLTTFGGGFGFEHPKTVIEVLREAAQAKPSSALDDPVTLRDVYQQRLIPMPVPPRFKRLLGNPSERFTMLLWGLPGSRKSTFAFRLLNDFAHNLPALYITTEEAANAGTMTLRARSAGAASANVEVRSTDNITDIKRWASEDQHKIVVLDSISMLSPRDVNEVLKLFTLHPTTTFIVVAHADKLGKSYSGIAKIGHVVDIVAHAEKGVIRARKNRWAKGPADTVEFRV